MARFISQLAGLHPARLRSEHYYTDKNGRRFRKEKGECETAAADLAGLGSTRKEDFQTQFILNKMLNNSCYIHNNCCCRISYTKFFGVKIPSSGVLYCTTTKNSSTTILYEFNFGRYPALRA